MRIAMRLNLLDFLFPNTSGNSHESQQQSDAEDSLLALFDPEEVTNPHLHARNCEKRNIYVVKTFRRMSGDIQMLKSMIADNRKVTIMVGLAIILSIWLPIKYTDVLGLIATVFGLK